ncbi:SURP and G-patch domain-containing protein 2 [Chelonia mydas]|uniref:SURP and G-patch domain-containing protein 2 n=1 Tax=Chelonia mydas TaxID=8469 RepID=M7AIC0_CHEMY|nr:SURP and G-patch domain-containing protein 2 [Chelonia mydas]
MRGARPFGPVRRPVEKSRNLAERIGAGGYIAAAGLRRAAVRTAPGKVRLQAVNVFLSEIEHFSCYRVKMASRRITRETFDAVVQDKVKRYRMDRNDAIEETIHHFKEIIKWAGFHTIKNDAEFQQLFGALFELETETCAKMLASFKCSLKPEHRDYCFFTIKNLQHAALKTPKVDNEFLNMLLDKGAMKTKNCFFEIIKPFDKYMMRLQDRLLKSVTPLLMACNAYELSIKTSGFSNSGEMAGAFETTISLCRKSLALLGQTFALASAFRQEKILEAVGLQEMAPAPTSFPNFDDSTLFGREYIENLKAWLEKSGYPIQMKKIEPESTIQLKKTAPDTRPKMKIPQRADRRVVETIEKLVNGIVTAGTMLKRQDKLTQGSVQSKPSISEISMSEKNSSLDTAGSSQHATSPEVSLSLEEVADTEDLSASTGHSQSLLSQFPDVDAKTMETAEKLAKFVAQVGPEIEQFSIDNSADNPDLWFLQDQNSSAFKFYRMKVYELCPSINFSAVSEIAAPGESDKPEERNLDNLEEEEEEEEEEDNEEEEEEAELEENISQTLEEVEMEHAEEGEAGGAEEIASKEMRSKTGDETSTGEMQPSSASDSTTPNLSAQVPASAPGIPFPRKRISSKSLKVGMIPASKRVCLIEEPKVHEPVRIAYDRPRGRPVTKKKKKPKDLDFLHKKLTVKNVGFQMLQKMGWQEGRGLGSQGKGIKEPVKVSESVTVFPQMHLGFYYFMKIQNNFGLLNYPTSYFLGLTQETRLLENVDMQKLLCERFSACCQYEEHFVLWQ